MGKKNKKWHKEYFSRTETLKRMGFSSYNAYLKSDLWKGIRGSKLDRDPWCYGCGGIASQVHHKKYTKASLMGQDHGALISVCHGCHFKAEFLRGNRKVPLKKANKRLNSIRRRRKRIDAKKFYAETDGESLAPLRDRQLAGELVRSFLDKKRAETADNPTP